MGKLTLRNMQTGEQESLKLEEIEERLAEHFQCN
jgi:histidyl-tRNA synthetase